MIVIAGLVILIAAVIAAMAGVLSNTGSSHAPGHALGTARTAAITVPGRGGSRTGWRRLPGHRTVPRQAAAAAQPQPLAGQPAPGVPGGAASPPPRIATLNGAAAKGAAEPG